jgi:hypothetical protein
MRRGPWKTVRGPILIQDGKRHDFITYCEVFIVGLDDVVMHVCNIHHGYVFLDNNVEIKGN